MKKILLAIFAAIWFLASPAYADSVSITTQAAFTNPATGLNAVPASDYYDFKGPKQNIVVSVAGKTCTLQGSGSEQVSGGCNYNITVSPTGSVSGTGNCTTDIASACK